MFVAAVDAFLALFLAVLVIVAAIVARRRDALRSRASLIVVALIVAAVVNYRMGFGVMRPA